MDDNQPKANILIVDDTLINLDLLTEILTGHGYKVRSVPSGSMALKAIRVVPPDLILLDIMMPEMDGYEVCQQLKADEQTCDIPVIFLSALTKTEDKVKALSIGAVDYITKPFQVEEVLARVETHLALRNMQKRLEEKNTQLQQEITEHKQAEKALRESKRKYRELVQNANSIILRVTPQWDITFFNEFAQTFFGYTEAEILGKNAVGTIVPESESTGRDLVALTNDIVHHPEQYRYNENENICSNGDRVWVAWTNKAITDNDERVIEILCIGANITERKRAEDALQKYERIVSATSDHISLVDRNYIYQVVNGAYLTAYDKPYDEIIGHSVGNLLGSDVFKNVIKENLDKCLTGETIDYQAWFAYKNLGQRFMSVTYSPYVGPGNMISGAVVSARDITGLKQTEDALRESQALFQSAFHNADVGMAIVHARSLQFVEVNQALCTLLGYSKEEFLTKSVIDITHPTDIHIGMPQVDQLLAGEQDTLQIEKRYLHKNGQVIWVILGAAIVRDMQREPLYFVSHYQDITERKQAEESLQKSEKRFRILFEATAAVSSTLDLATVLHHIAEQMGQSIDTTSAYICCWKAATQTCTVLAEYFGPQACEQERISDMGVTYQEDHIQFLERLNAGQPDTSHIDDPDLFEGERDHMQQYGAQTALFIPLLTRGQVIAFAELWESRRQREFTTEEIVLCQSIAQNAAIAIENARLYDLAQQEITERKRAEKALQLTQFSIDKAADIVFWIGEDGRLFYVNETACRSLGYLGEELLTKTIHDIDPNYPPEAWAAHWKTTQQRSVTVESRYRTKEGQYFPVEITFTYLEFDGQAYNFVFAHDITWRRWSAEALRESEERHRLIANRLQNELILARQIQQGLLPAGQPNWPGLDVVCYSSPAQEVGGDFYTYHTFEDGHFAIAVGDVSGKGMPAALLMGVSLASFQSAIGQGFTPGELMTYLDQALVPYTHTTHQNCALVYVEISPTIPETGEFRETQTHTLRVVNAGCVEPIIRRSGGSVEWIKTSGMPLGQNTKFDYREVVLALAKGDLIILISDGVIEARNSAGDLFSFERFEQAVACGPQIGAEAMLTHLQAAVEGFIGEAEPHDDLTLVVMQVRNYALTIVHPCGQS